jgi:hypothetical protein
MALCESLVSTLRSVGCHPVVEVQYVDYCGMAGCCGNLAVVCTNCDVRLYTAEAQEITLLEILTASQGHVCDL